jgi:ribosome maturation factor RimP
MQKSSDLKKEKYNEYMRNYRLKHKEKMKQFGRDRYYKKSKIDVLSEEDISKYKNHLDKIYKIKKAISELIDEDDEIAEQVILDILSTFL